MIAWEPSDELLREVNAKAHAAALAEGYTGVRADGFVDGFMEGFIEGSAQGACHALRTVLHHRFGALTLEQEARLQAASLDMLDRWTSRALTSPSIDVALDDSSEAQ